MGGRVTSWRKGAGTDQPPATRDGNPNADGDDLARGRDAGHRLAWADAYRSLSLAEQSAPLAAEDLELLATAAYLLGHVPDCLQALQRAHRAHVAAGDLPRAARCVFRVGFVLLDQGDLTQAGGWLGRANRLLKQQPECAEHGLLLLPVALHAGAVGDHAGAHAAAARAAEIGSRVGDPDVLSLSLHFQGRALIRLGRVS